MRRTEGTEPTASDERWRQLLVHHPRGRRNRQVHRRIPSSPRCKLCLAPFGLPGSLVMPMLRHGRWPKNPKYCEGCFLMLERSHGGAEVDCSLLFADVRGSTSLAEQISARDFNRLMGRFHDVGFSALIDHDAFVDKFVGDQIIGIFVPAMAGETHWERAIDAALDLLERLGGTDAVGASIPVGIGIGTGLAYVGVVGEGPDTDMTAMGDLVNTTARLASVAGAGEILLTVTAATTDAIDGLERRTLELKGKSTPTEVAVMSLSEPRRERDRAGRRQQR